MWVSKQSFLDSPSQINRKFEKRITGLEGGYQMFLLHHLSSKEQRKWIEIRKHKEKNSLLARRGKIIAFFNYTKNSCQEEENHLFYLCGKDKLWQHQRLKIKKVLGNRFSGKVREFLSLERLDKHASGKKYRYNRSWFMDLVTFWGLFQGHFLWLDNLSSDDKLHSFYFEFFRCH